ALVFPSLYEGFGQPPLEAMACGCPVAVSLAGALPEVCGDAARYFDPLSVEDMAEAILDVVEHGREHVGGVRAGTRRRLPRADGRRLALRRRLEPGELGVDEQLHEALEVDLL